MTQTSQFKILNISINTLDKIQYPILMDNFNSLIVHESIYQKGMVAELSFFDAYDYLNLIPLVGGETVQITLSDNNDAQFIEEFIIVERSGVVNRDGTGLNDILLKLTQKTYYSLITRNFSKSIYGEKSTVNNIINTILSEINPTYELSKDSIIIPNKLSIQHFPIRYTLDECFHYLIENNGIQDAGKMYMIYDRKNRKFKITSDKTMSQGKSYGIFSFSDKYNDYNTNYIFKLTTNPGLSTKSLNTRGLFYSKTYNVDSVNKRLNVSMETVNDFMEVYNQKFSSIHTEVFEANKDRSDFWSYLPFLYNNDLSISYKNRISNHLRRSISHTITVAGKFDIYIGTKITPFFKRAYNTMEAYETFNGDYIVTGIAHKFGADSMYYQDLTIAKSEIYSSDKYKSRLIERRTK